MLSVGQQASAGLQVHDRVVNGLSAAWTPQVQNGRVLTFAQVGTTMVAGGNFSSVKQGPTTSARSNIVAFDATTGAVVGAFNPQFNGVVNTLLPGPTAGTVYVGGAFSTLNGVAVPRVVLLRTTDGARVTTFTAPAIANGVVNDIERIGNRLYIGGTFTKVQAVAHAGLASLNATSGALDPYVNLQFSGHHNWAGSGAKAGVGVSKMAVSPDGRWLTAIGNFTDIGTFHRDQVAMLDLGGPSAAVRADWSTSRYAPRCFDWAFDSYIRDVDWAPSGEYFAIVATGGPNPGTLCDTVARWETADTGQAVEPTWVDDTGGDTLFSVAVTGSAIYVGGHQRWLNNAGGLDAPAPGAVPRAGIGAVDPVSGVPLEWNPGRNPRGVGAFTLYATSAGLWVGSDTNYIGNKQYFRPRIAFFPLAGGERLPAGVSPSLPGDVYLGGSLPGANSNVLYRINAGGPTIGAVDNGPDWEGDTEATSAYRNDGSNAAGWDPVANVDNSVDQATTPRAIFDSERWDPGSAGDGGEMHWAFPVPAGTTVEVRLYYANRYGGTAEEDLRVFDINVEGGAIELDNLDIAGSVGHSTGHMEHWQVTSDGAIDIDFGHEIENPLINGIEIINSDLPPPPTGDAGLRYRHFTDGTSFGGEQSAPGGGVDWSTIRGTTYIDDTLFYARNDGMLYRRTFDGTTYGTEQAIDPYNDPAWSNVNTGSGQTYRGVRPTFYNQLSSLTGLVFTSGRLYYTLAGSDSLHYRLFSPESGIVSPEQFTAPGATVANTRGMFLSGGFLYFADRASGTLRRTPWNGGAPDTTSGSTATVDSTVDWRARALFVGP